jgi:diguanylate cyclase (GGDEF)-like protein
MSLREKQLRDIYFIYEKTLPDFGPGFQLGNRINFLELSHINKNLLNEDPHAKIVFFPLKTDRNIFHKEIRTIFPLAEFISYSYDQQPELERISREMDFSFHLYMPVSPSLLDYIYNHNSSLLNEIEKKLALQQMDDNKILSLFNAVLDILNLNQDKETIFKEFALLMCRLLESENFLIYIYNEEKKQLDLIHAIKNIFEENKLLDFKFNNVILEEIFQLGQVFLNNDFNYEFESYLNKSPYMIRSILALPFKSVTHSSGLFLSVNKKNPSGFNEFDVHYMQILSHPFNLIYDSLIYHERVQKLTITDDLTSLYNFRYLRQYLGFEIKRSLRYEKNLSLLFIDIDNFKHVNDTHGHLVGSATLCEVGQLFNKQVRDTDVIVRYGGDEFVIILPETTLEGAKVIGERLRQRVENYVFSGGRDLLLKLTISIGIASCPEHSMTAEGLLQKADAAMYAAKEDSKNNIKIAG